jgi:hypothetical protein
MLFRSGTFEKDLERTMLLATNWIVSAPDPDLVWIMGVISPT